MAEIDWEKLLSRKEEKKGEVPPPQPTQPPNPPQAPSQPPAPAKAPSITVPPIEEESMPPSEELVKSQPKVEVKPEVKVPETLLVEEPIPTKEVWLIFGDKGTGKTTTALSFPGEILVLSFDRKSSIVKFNMFNNDPRIHIFDIVKYMDYSTPEAMTASAEKTFEYLNYLLDNYLSKYSQPDWVVIDGAQIFQQIAEWTMRHRHDLGPFDGISNLNLWKERRMYIRQIHNKALNIAKRGIIYTTYVEKDEVVIRGEVVTRKDAPAWIDVLIYETDYVLYTYFDEAKKTYHVRVVSSKNDKKIKSGSELDVTNKPFANFVKWG
jgi:hypothetical protein